MASPRASHGPSTSEKTAIPEPYNRSSRAVCKQLRQIHKACGQWPWEFLPGRIPEALDKHMLAPLVTAVEFACDDEHNVTLSELTEWLMGQKGDWVLTSTHSSNALDWVIYTHDKRANRRRSTNNGTDSGRPSSRARKRQHSNDEVIFPRPPRPDPQSRQKKRWAETRSPTAEDVAEVKAQSEPGPEPEPDFEPEPEPEPELELDHDMEMDVDDSNPNGDDGENTNANINTNTNLGGTNKQTLEEAIAASARRLEVARDNLKEYEDELETEREALKTISDSLSEASEAHEAAIQKWRDAVLQADTKQNELQQFQNLAQSFSRDTQAALEQHSQSLRHLSDQAIEEEKHAEDELRTRRRAFCILEDRKDTKEGTIKKISARIRRYQDDIDAEEVKHQRLLAEHYLELLSNDIIQGISIADISYAKILEIKLERDQRIWVAAKRYPVLCSDLSNFLTQLPSCAESCVLDFVSASSCGTNATCLCTNPKLKDDVLPCVESHCLPREALAAINLTSVACDFPIRDKHEQFNILTITLIVITGITVGLRFLEKIRYGPGLQLDDYVITGAFCDGCQHPQTTLSGSVWQFFQPYMG
ncbi:hypothetical protein HZS61_005506 [Fusarium oxysporum f. sp. conglutinans]|uniref:CFEM domain-containing protein n=1 Tax=Fusarium oxysporum f. sp. conglutinans TaxID=100902 RepID=A0A8H6GAR4_FUSOX|nr:hypothetical protein HZS61_005506 [Fusarium oxysporum f. sp. conglutinans]